MVWAVRDRGMITFPKYQAILSFLQETKELTDGRKVSVRAPSPEDRKATQVLLCSPVIDDVEVIISHLWIQGAPCLTKGEDFNQASLGHSGGSPIQLT